MISGIKKATKELIGFLTLFLITIFLNIIRVVFKLNRRKRDIILRGI